MRTPLSVISRPSRRGSTPVAVERLLDDAGQVGAADLARGDVDEHLPGEVRVPGEEVARLPQDPGAERRHELGLLADVDELLGQQQPALGVTPADERLEGDRRPGAQVDDRLVVQLEVAAAERGAQLLLDGQPVQRLLAVRLVVDLPARATAVLGDVEGGVGVAEHLVGGAVAVGDGQAGAQRRDDLVVAEPDRLLDGVDDALQRLAGVVHGA